MPKPTEHKSVQARILKYACEIGWNVVSQSEAERRRGFNASAASPKEKAKAASRFFADTLFQKVAQFNPQFDAGSPTAKDDLLRLLNLPLPTIHGNRDFLHYLQGVKTFFSKAEGREFNLILIDYDNPANNVYEVSEEYYLYNGQYANRADVVFFINGIPVVVIECKNATKDEAIAIGIDQLRRYHRETPELMVPQQLFTATESIGFSYGVTWNTVRRNIFNWKDEEIGNLEAKLKSFCNIQHVLDLLKKFILFAEQNEELAKFILRQHQKAAVDKVVERALDPTKQRGLVWHTQGSGKTYTMIKTAELLFKAPQAEKPTVLLMIDRNELEDQMLKNLASIGVNNVEPADSIQDLQKLLKQDYRGIVVSMVHKFRDMPANVSLRKNIYVLIDEAHRTTGGDLGNFLMAAVPNATFIGFTGTPVDKTVYGKGTFKTFGIDDDQGYLHKYSIADSIVDGTTLPLFYGMAPNDLLVPKEILEQEFLNLADAYGVNDIEELNKILERAVNTKNFLKGTERVDKVAAYVAKHYKENVEPLGYKAFLVGVDRPACALYKKALDKYLPPEYSEVVYTGNNNDTEELKAYHNDAKREKEIRKKFTKLDEYPKILIVTEKLLTGFDAPILYAMYLDKPMRDHTLLQAIARVNRPYENEEKEMVKPHGFVLDFVGIFENLEKALAFDSDEINAIVKDIQLLKYLFQSKMDKNVPPYLELIKHNFNDKDTDNLIDYFRDKSRRKEFFKLYKEIEMLYEIISPDKFLRPYIDTYATVSAIYGVVRNAYAKRVQVDREFQRKTNELVQSKVAGSVPDFNNEFFEINEQTIEKIKDASGNDNTRVINLIKSIEKIAEENSDDPFLVGIRERAEAVEENYESRQQSTQEALDEIKKLLEEDLKRRKEQAEKGYDDLTFFVYKTLLERGLKNPEEVTGQIKGEFINHPNWRSSEKELRELRKAIYYAVFAEEDDLDKVAKLVDDLFNHLFIAFKL
ncbi:type I restriction endonuclease subunit R [Flavisolibacter ginsenosidimutans]|uniref:Type I restriction enzyme endonuclease subunit n=1 Tax=Flavisolibacter ginsenosidimutans TaxID=661481 RepID=A0A5B8UFA3_9BACT|nr:HsdR family type I site-specific deoxyribonuclease [Flavisolibacter ginsenosidimutans]QEC55337.1 HsdR family type I site-specific deoxyribonuclease [Flavisolibacter ginsenosidimutans]